MPKFGTIRRYVSQSFEKASSGLQEQIAETITALIEKVMRPMLMQYIAGEYHLKDGTTVQGQSAFDRMVTEDKDVLVLIETFRPSYLFYLDKAKKVKTYIRWNNSSFADGLADFLEANGVIVNDAAYSYLWRTCDRFRRRIYS